MQGVSLPCHIMTLEATHGSHWYISGVNVLSDQSVLSEALNSSHSHQLSHGLPLYKHTPPQLTTWFFTGSV